MKRNSFKAKFLSFTLAAALLAGSTGSAWAAEPEPAETSDSSVTETDVTSENSETVGTVSVSSGTENGSEGSTSAGTETGSEGSSSGSSASSGTETASGDSTYSETESSSENTPGSTDGVSDSSADMTSDTEAADGDNAGSGTDTSDGVVPETDAASGVAGTGLGAPPEPTINLVFNSEHTRFDLVFSGYAAAEGETLCAAVWSVARGQDDLEWVELALQTDGTYKKTVNISDFADPGTVDIHIYKYGADGSAAYVAGKSDDIPTIIVGDLKLVSGMSDGTAVISSETVSSASGIASARAAAWSKADQSDLHWYDMHEESSGDWTFTIDLKNHNNNPGKYSVHMYAVDGNGFTRYAAGKSFDFSGLTGGLDVKVTGSDSTYTAEISGFSSAAPIKEIRVATWTETGGQDDISWHVLSLSGAAASATSSVSDFKHYGTA